MGAIATYLRSLPEYSRTAGVIVAIFASGTGVGMTMALYAGVPTTLADHTAQIESLEVRMTKMEELTVSLNRNSLIANCIAFFQSQGREASRCIYIQDQADFAALVH